MASVADLKVADLDKQIAAQGDTCTGGVGMTRGGAILSQVTCDGDVVSTAVDGTELTEIRQWDAAGIDQALGELKQVQDPQSLTLTFLTPKSGTVKARTSLRSVGPKIKGVGGKECMVTVNRLGGAAEGNQGLLEWGGCDTAEPLGAGPFALADITGAKLEAALAKAAAAMGITTADVGQFDVYLGLSGQGQAGDAGECWRRCADQAADGEGATGLIGDHTSPAAMLGGARVGTAAGTADVAQW